MEETLIDFLLELNAKGLINDYDLDYEKEAKDFVKKTKKKQLTLTDVGCSLLDLDARISEVESEIIKNKINDLEHKQAFKLGFSTCYYWIAEKLK